MQKVDLTKWGGTVVRNNLKPLWPKPVEDDAEFGTYQQSIATSIQNTNELIDETARLKAEQAQIQEDLKTRPF